MFNQNYDSQNTDQLLTSTEVAELLKVTTRTIHRWRKSSRRPLPAHVVNGKVFFFKHEVLSWISSHKDYPMLSTPIKLKK